MVKIVNKISNNKNHFTGVNPCKFITIHETGNPSRGSNALNHAKYIDNGSKATWHYTVDKDWIVQHFNDNVQCWHAGDGRGKGNTQSIGIEMCINSDGNYLQTIDRTVNLVVHLMKKHNISINNVVQHNHWSGKNCPMLMRSGKHGITWNQFLSKIKSKFNNDKQTSDNKKLYKVQVGAYSVKSNADAMAAKLKAAGYDTYITTKGGTPAGQTIKVGSKVKVKKGAKTYTGGNLASFVYNNVYDIIQINGDRVVIGKGTAVTAAVHKNDLILQ